MDDFGSFAMWALQAVIGGAVAVAYAALVWVIKSHLALQRQIDRDYVSTPALQEALRVALAPLNEKLDASAARVREREEALRDQFAELKEDILAREKARADTEAELAGFIRDIGQRLDLTVTRDKGARGG